MCESAIFGRNLIFFIYKLGFIYYNYIIKLYQKLLPAPPPENPPPPPKLPPENPPPELPKPLPPKPP